MSERIVYIEWQDACCLFNDGTRHFDYRSNDDLIEQKALAAIVWLAPDETNPHGDDWNDAPMCANAGPPYERFEGLRRVEVRYGEPWPALETGDKP